MTDEERDYKDWLQSREIEAAFASVEAAQDEYDGMVHELNSALAERDRLAAENAALADRLVDAQTLNTSLLRLSRKLQGRSQRRLARMRELEALLTDALGRMEKVFGTLEDEDVYMATVNRIRAALGEQVADESEEE